MQKAKLRVDPIEREYAKRHGKLPDYHYTELWNKYGRDVADKTVQTNMDAIWNDMRQEHDRMTHGKFEPCPDNPFHSDNRTERGNKINV